MHVEQSAMLSAEQERLASLRRMLSIGGPSSTDYVRTLRLARQLLGVPIAYVSVIDEHCQCMAAVLGTDIGELPREHSLCHKAVAQGRLLVCEDTLASTEFRDNPIVVQAPFIRSFAAMPIRSPEGQYIGALCVADSASRSINQAHLDALEDLAFGLEAVIALRYLAGSHGQALEQVGELVQTANTDPLTQLLNRRGVSDMAYHAYARSHLEGRGFALAMIDLDHFKKINDSFGHDAGDAALVVAATRLRQAVRGGDLVGRWGGEEFVMVLPAARHGELEAVGERLVAAIRGEVEFGLQRFPLTASVGIAWTDAQGQRFDIDGLLKRADQAMYAAKSAGRNRAVVEGSSKDDLAAGAAKTAQCPHHCPH